MIRAHSHLGAMFVYRNEAFFYTSAQNGPVSANMDVGRLLLSLSGGLDSLVCFSAGGRRVRRLLPRRQPVIKRGSLLYWLLAVRKDLLLGWGQVQCGQVPSHVILCFAFSLILTSGGARQTGCWCFAYQALARLSRDYPNSFSS